MLDWFAPLNHRALKRFFVFNRGDSYYLLCIAVHAAQIKVYA